MEVKKLENGVRLVVLPLPGAYTVTTEVFVKLGSKYERPGEFGMSHFLEHMAFKGSKRWPKVGQVSKMINAKGASYNASTDHEVTSYFIKTGEKDSHWSIEILSDILVNPIFRDKEVDRERGVIKEEIRMYKDNPMMGLADDFCQFIFGSSKIGRWDIAGSEADADKLSKLGLVDFRHNYIDPARMVIVVAGNVRGVKSSKEQVQSYFEEFENNKVRELPQVDLRWSQDKQVRVERGLDQAHFCLGLPSLSWRDKRRYALRLMEIILVGNSSSRLFSEIREKRGWAYYVSLASMNFAEGGYMAVQSGVRKDKLDEAVELSRRVIRGLTKIKQTELKRAKSFLQGRRSLAMEQTSFWTEFVGRKLLLEDERVDPLEDTKKYLEVEPGEIEELAKEILTKDFYLMAVK